jgi:two-component system sensor histidine kinase KdpD
MARDEWWRKLQNSLIAVRLGPIVACLFMIVAFTAALATLSQVVSLEQVTIVYLIPVMVAATRWGVVPAVITALAAIAVCAFFFYPPIYDFRVQKIEHIADLVLFVLVAVVMGRLATTAREAEMRSEAEMLREAMIGAVSHELRSPLSSIVGAVSVLSASPEIANSTRLSPLVQGLHDEAERLNEHIQNLLDATRIKTEGIKPNVEWVEPGDIVNAALERKAELLAKHRLAVRVVPDLPLIRTDPALIEKALGQLLENAAKYSPAGSVIEIFVEQRDVTVRIAVRDQGAGFAPDEREVIWERFYRSPRHRDRIAGSGLGLWIARALARACGAETEAYSAGAAQGATFSLLLPVHPNPEAYSLEDSDE